MFRFNILISSAAASRLTVLGMIVLVSSGSVAAQSKRSNDSIERAVAVCSERDSNLQRLECYDALAERIIQNSPRAGAPRLTAPEPESDGITTKMVKEQPKKVTVELESRREVRLKTGKILRPRMRVDCGEKVSLTVQLGLKLPVGKVAVNTRVDKKDVVKELWAVGADRLGVIAPDGTSIGRRLKGAQILEVKISPRKSEPIPFSFELEELHERCGDSIP